MEKRRSRHPGRRLAVALVVLTLLINAWYNPNTPEGEVARASWERWGIPLRPADVAEMEYREWFYDVNAGRIDQWVQATNPSSYAGYYIDHAAGGVMRVGFLDNQAERLAGLKASLPLVAGERLQVTRPPLPSRTVPCEQPRNRCPTQLNRTPPSTNWSSV